MRRAIVIAAVSAVLLPALPAAASESRTPLIGVNGFSALVRLQPGDSGKEVATLQRALTDAGFYHSEIDGEYGDATSSAVVAFHKYLRLERSSTFSARSRSHSVTNWATFASRELNSVSTQPHYVAKPKARQLLRPLSACTS